MIETLPRRYQVTLWVVGVLACVGAGAWLAFIIPVVEVWQYGAVIGALAAPVLVSAYCRTLCHRAEAPAPRRAA